MVINGKKRNPAEIPENRESGWRGISYYPILTLEKQGRNGISKIK
jgi:hypothetical protein